MIFDTIGSPFALFYAIVVEEMEGNTFTIRTKFNCVILISLPIPSSLSLLSSSVSLSLPLYFSILYLVLFIRLRCFSSLWRARARSHCAIVFICHSMSQCVYCSELRFLYMYKYGMVCASAQKCEHDQWLLW